MPTQQFTKYETARIIGARALQISRGAPLMIKTKLNDPIEIATLELKKGVLPINIKKRKIS